MSFLNSDDVPLFSLAGFTLNVEERASLFSSLAIKRDQEKLSNIYLWGKILAIQQDYFIAQSVGATPFERKYYYTLDNFNWYQLPEITPEEAKQADSIQGRFLGDPSHEHIVPADASDADAQETKLREEKRLTAVVSAINYEVQIVPRGAYYRDLSRKIKSNPEFRGLPHENLGREHCYLHFREGFEVNFRTLSDRINKYDDAIDIFESIDMDAPKGAWSMQKDTSGNSAILRSMLWPGYTFVHSLSPLKYSSFYYGTGQKNHNIGFMI